MTLDLAQIGMALIATGFGLLVAGHGWWRNPTDHLTNALSACRTAASTLFAKGPRT